MKKQAGFTLIEMIVVVGLFSVVLTIAMGAIFTVVNANKTSQGLAAVMDNLSGALDVLSRNTRFGNFYQCGDLNGFTAIAEPGAHNCGTGNPVFAFHPYNKAANVMWAYKFIKNTETTGRLWRCEGTSGSSDITSSSTGGCDPVTASEVYLTNIKFYVDGTTVQQQQPRVFIIVDGYALSGTIQQPFSIQTLISQRTLNI